MAEYRELDQLKEQYPVVSAVPDVEGDEVRLVAEEAPHATAEVLTPNLEDAYIYFMQSAGQEMDLEVSYGA